MDDNFTMVDDAKRLFEEDVREKKIIARSAKNKKSHSGCHLPSDFMSRKEVEQMNGEVKVINANLIRPLTWKYFRMLSKEDQTCPFLCDDPYYNRMPADDMYCGLGEEK